LSDTEINDSAEKRYLLGMCTEEERNLLEEGFFADESKFKALELAEDDLIDAFVRNKLRPKERRDFTAKLFSSDRLIQRVNFARVLAERADSSEVSKQEPVVATPRPLVSQSKAGTHWWENLFAHAVWRPALAASVVLIILASWVLISRWWQIRSETERLSTERAVLQRQKEELDKLALEQQTRNNESAAEMQREREHLAERLSALEEASRPSTPTNRLTAGFATIFLTPGSLRSGGGRSHLKLPPGTATAQLFIELERNDYPSYDASIKGVDNEQVVFSQRRLKPRKTGSGQVLVLLVPANRLPPADYNVSVHGVTKSGELESVQDYPFRVTQR